MSKIINQLRPDDFDKSLDEAAFAEWQKSLEAHENAGFAVLGLQVAGLLLLLVLGGLVGVVLYLGLAITGLVIVLPKQNKRKACQRQLGISNSDLKQAIINCRNRMKGVNVASDAQPREVFQPEKNENHADHQLRDDVKEQAVEPPSCKGIQWFFRVICRYAHFSGRARRKEYWTFVLFNIIFNVAWTLLLMLAFWLSDYDFDDSMNNYISFTYSVLLMLPILSVVARRLHDTGRSGWMALVILIPIAGIFWLLALMLIEGEQGENKYGPDPKISEPPFDEPAKWKSAGRTLIVSASLVILVHIASLITHMVNYEIFDYWMLFRIVADALLLTTGIYLLKEKQICSWQENGRSIIILLASASIYLLLSIAGLSAMILFQESGWFLANSFVHLIMNLSVILFAAFFLFLPQNKSLIRNVAVTAILFSGLVLLLGVYSGIEVVTRNYHGDEWVAVINILSLFGFLIPVAYIVFLGTYLSVKESSVPVSASTPQHDREKLPAKGKSTVFGGSLRPHFILEHKVGFKYRRAGEAQRVFNNYVEIGRDPSCEVRYDEQFETVSRRHAAIVKDGNNWKLIRLSQTNPTFVNGEIVHKEWYLQHGDEIQCAVNGPKLEFKMPIL